MSVGINDNEYEEVELKIAPVSQEDEEIEEVAETPMIVMRLGDIFVYENGVVCFCILDISEAVSAGKIYKIRLFSSVIDSIEVGDDELLLFIENNNLKKLDTFRDQIEAVSKTIIFNNGDTYTKNRELFIEVLSDVLSYVNPKGEETLVVGIRSQNGVVAFRSILEVVAEVFGKTDQFPPEN